MTPFLRKIEDLLGETRGAKARAKAKRQGLTCEALEDRQLLSFGGGHLGAFGAGLAGPGRHGMGRASMVGRFGGHGHAAAGSVATSAATSATPAATATTATTATGTAASGSTAPAAPAAPPANVPFGVSFLGAPSTQAQTDAKQLQADLHAIAAKSGVTVAQQVALGDDLQAIKKAATGAPTSATATALQNDLKALNGLLPTADQSTQLGNDFSAYVKSAGVTDQTVIDKAITDAQAIVTASNVTNDDLSKIVADRKALAADMTATTADTSSTTTTTSTTPSAPDTLTGLPFDVIFGGAAIGGLPGGPAGGFAQDWGGPAGGFARGRGGPMMGSDARAGGFQADHMVRHGGRFGGPMMQADARATTTTATATTASATPAPGGASGSGWLF